MKTAMRPAMKRVLLLCAALGFASGCAVTVKGGPLSNRPETAQRLYLSTGGSPYPFRTIGFVQIRGYGVSVAGLPEVGDVAIDGAIKKTLVDEAMKLGGDGVINIDFLDENPQTPAERAQAMAQSLTPDPQTGQTQIQSKDRYVTVTGEVVKFVGR